MLGYKQADYLGLLIFVEKNSGSPIKGSEPDKPKNTNKNNLSSPEALEEFLSVGVLGGSCEFKETDGLATCE